MLKLGQIINPYIVNVINQIGDYRWDDVEEREKVKAFVDAAQPQSIKWNDLLKVFGEQITAKDPKVVGDLQKKWDTEIDIPKMPRSFAEKLKKQKMLTFNEEEALKQVCE
jgi:hypothetical protein